MKTTEFPAIERSSATITLSVWRALFLREAVTRLFSGRASWVWILAEPIFHVSYLAFLFTMIRLRYIGGIDTAIWVIVGMLSFFMFRRTGMQSKNAISANGALFAYRQVKPVDAVLVRVALEGFLMLIVIAVTLCGAALLGHVAIPADPLQVMVAWFGLWLLGAGLGLLGSVARELVPEMDSLIKMAMMPLYFLSGVIAPIASVPPPFRGWFMLNPVAHGLEAARLGYAPHYHAVPELSVAYLYQFALVSIFMGLVLHRVFANRLVTQ